MPPVWMFIFVSQEIIVHCDQTSSKRTPGEKPSCWEPSKSTGLGLSGSPFPQGHVPVQRGGPAVWARTALPCGFLPGSAPSLSADEPAPPLVWIQAVRLVGSGQGGRSLGMCFLQAKEVGRTIKKLLFKEKSPLVEEHLLCLAIGPRHPQAPAATHTPGLHGLGDLGQRPRLLRNPSTDVRDCFVKLLHGFVSRRDNGSQSRWRPGAEAG